MIDMATVRDLYLEALAMKAKDVPWRQIRAHLLDRGHEIGNVMISEVGTGDTYQLTFTGSGEKISFDGTDYHFDF
jgi:hypothetical protein